MGSQGDRGRWPALLWALFLCGSGPALAAPPPAQEAQELLAAGYRHKSAGDIEGALAAFTQARDLGADTQRIALELGYLHAAQGRLDAARRSFAEASTGPDLLVADQARSELKSLPDYLRADLYAEALGWSRAFGGGLAQDLVPMLRGRLYLKPSLDVDVQLYFFVQVTRDLASHGRGRLGGVPSLYADNFALTGAGVLARFWSQKAGFFAQVGPAFNLMDDGGGRVLLDARAGLFLGLESSGCRPLPVPGVHLGLAPCAELYGESVYVSRFDHNVITFARGRAALTYLNTGPLLWQAVLEGRATVDRLGHYYNNFADAGAGHRWRLLGAVPLDVQLAFHAGAFLGRRSVDPLPTELRYADLRVQAVTYFEF